MTEMTDEEFRALIEQSHQLHELTKHPGWSVLVDYMETVVMRPLKQRMLDGAIDSMEEYKKASGLCVGATRCLNAWDEVGKQVERARTRRDETGWMGDDRV